ncbi:MAG: DUF2271 domain-containing protein [Clostridia bacterium]|nr:DUF2271 domain-containing protein [Clostridia bacterium]NCD03408.1 DUF2271 domain-containing protein [Clostridia bacterium]
MSFTFTRGSTPASNQYAVWIEDTEGALVKTLYVTNFTANGGYTTREDSVPTWVAKAGPATMSADEIDAVSGATPQAGNVTYTWDGTDLDGNKVPDGIYTFYLEGTLYWSSRVLASGRVTLGGEDQAVIPVTSEFSSADATNRDMLTNVSASYFANTDSMEDENMNTSTISAGGPMSPEDALEYMKNTPDLVIVEVNAPEWKLDTGFTGALWIPHTEMEERYNEIPEGVPVILHCGAGVVSVPAYETLLEKRPDIPMLSYIAGRPPVAEYNAWFASQN